MCLFNPLHRVGVEQALTHPYLAGITSEQDRKTAKAIDPADVTYDKIFDGVGKSGEPAALEQLGRLLRREVAKFNPTRTDTTPERSQVHATLKTATSARTPRSGPQNAAEASMTAPSGGVSAVGSSSSAKLAPSHSESALVMSSSDRMTAQQPHSDGLASWQRRRSEPEVDYWARRAVSSRGQTSDTSPLTRRRSADDGRPTTIEPSRHPENLDSFRRVAPGEEHMPMSLPAPPANVSVPAAFWLTSEDKGPAKSAQRISARSEYTTSAPKRRVPACSGGSTTTVSTRATPSTRPSTEASTRASSRFPSASRQRVPSLGPQCTTQWVAEPEGRHSPSRLHGLTGPADAATASPRAGPPEMFSRTPQRTADEGHLGSRPHNSSTGTEDASTKQNDGFAQRSGMLEHRSSQRSLLESASALRESASASQPGLPPDLERPLRHESLASLDEVLREMKALLRNAPERDNEAVREAQEQSMSRPAATVIKTSSSHAKPLSARSITRPSIGLRGHRAAAVGRAADMTVDDRSPSSARAVSSQRRLPPQRSDGSGNRSTSRQRLDDELDFAVPEPIMAADHQTPRRHRQGEAQSAPTPPWADSRKPLETLEDNGNSAPAVPWARGGSARNVQDIDQDWRHSQDWTSAHSSKVHGTGGYHQRPLARCGSQVKRTAASENHPAKPSLSAGLGFIF